MNEAKERAAILKAGIFPEPTTEAEDDAAWLGWLAAKRAVYAELEALAQKWKGSVSYYNCAMQLRALIGGEGSVE